MKTAPWIRIPIAAFLMDCALYFALTGVPYKAIALGTSPWALGLLPAAYSLVYAGLALNSWRFTGSENRLHKAQILLPLGVLAFVLLSFARHWLGLFLPLSLLGFTLAFFWPPLQALLADLSPPHRLAKNLGVFNVAWSSGKGFGFLLGGVMLQRWGFSALFWTAAAMAAGVWFLVRALHAEPKPCVTADDGRQSLHPRHTAFMVSAWIANTLSFGSIAVLNYHYPKHLIRLELSESVFGTCLGVILLTQTVVFWWLRRHLGWQHKVWVLLGAQVLVILTLVVLPGLEKPLHIFAVSPLMGLGIGVAYFSSVSYSVEDRKSRGRNAGVHEGSLALGALSLPMLGAVFSHTTAGPLMATAVVISVGLLAQAGILLFCPETPRR